MAYCLITGATSGIGEQFATKYAKRGFDLFLVSRNKDNLKSIKKLLSEKYTIRVETLAIDLSLNGSAKEVYEYALKKKMVVDVLINNAGFGDFGCFDCGDLDKFLNMIDLNDKALVSLSYYFINDMKTRNKGQILNVASIAGFMPGPYMSVYYASKAFVLSFSLSLKEELKPYNIKVTTLCPGPVNTPFWYRAKAEMSSIKRKLFARSPEEVATTGLKAIDDNKGLVIDGVFNKLTVFGIRLLPLEVRSSLLYKVQGRLNSRLNKGEERYENSI